MAEKEQENFYRNSTVIVDHGKEALAWLLDDEMSKNNTNLVDFINLHQHAIYHLCFNRQPCCANNVLLATRPRSKVLNTIHLGKLLDKFGQKPQGHNPGNKLCCCSPANPNITLSQLDLTLLGCLLRNFSIVYQYPHIGQAIEELVTYRNDLYGHATEAKISDIDYATYQKDLERVLMIIARYCNKENEMKQKLRDADTRPLDKNILLQYQNTLLSEIQQNREIEKKITDLQIQIHEGEGRILAKLQTIEDKTDPIGQRRRAFIEHTNARIATMDESMYCLVYALRRFEKCSSTNNVVTVVSKRGGGKSCFCMQMANYFQQKGYTPIILVNDEVVRNRDLIDSSSKNIYILEDFFGKEHPQLNEDIHRNILDMLYSCFNQPSCKSKLMITLRTGQPSSNLILDAHEIFRNESVVDLDVMSFTERMGTLQYHLNKNCFSLCTPIFKNLGVCFKNCPTDVMDNDDGSLTICLNAWTYICRSSSDSDIGFPDICRLFCCDKTSKTMGAYFFARVSDSLINEVKEMYTDAFDRVLPRYQFSVLWYVSICKHIDMENFNIEYFKSRLCVFKENSAVEKSLLKQAIDSLKGKYLLEKPKSRIQSYLTVKRGKYQSASVFHLLYSAINDALNLAIGVTHEEIMDVKLEGYEMGKADARRKLSSSR